MTFSSIIYHKPLYPLLLIIALISANNVSACDTTPTMEANNVVDIGGGFFTVDLQICVGETGSEDGFDVAFGCGLSITNTDTPALNANGGDATPNITTGVLNYVFPGFPGNLWEPDPSSSPCFNFTVTVDGDPSNCTFTCTGLNDGTSCNTSGVTSWDGTVSGPCISDFSVTAPGAQNGNTNGAGDDCDLRSSEEQIIEVVIPCDETWTFSLCGANWDTYLFLGNSCCSGSIASNDDASGFCSPQSVITEFLTAGTYYVTVEAWSTFTTGAYTLDISSAGTCNTCSYTVNAGTDATVCDGDIYALDGSSTGGVLNTTWSSSGDGVFSDVTSPTSTYTPGITDLTVGSVTLTITTDDPTGICTSESDDLFLTISSNPDASITGISPICQNATAVNLSATDAGGEWSGMGITNSDLGTFDPLIAGPGIWNISYTISGSCGDIDNTSVTVTPQDNASFNFAQSSICISDPNPSPGISGTTGGIFSIDNNGVIDLNTGEINLLSSGAGSYNISYTTLGSCSALSTEQITIGALPDASIAPVSSLCENSSSINLSATDLGGEWSGMGITNSNTGLFDPIAAGVGTWNITYLINGVCSSTDDITITVNPLDDPSFNYSQPIYCLAADNPVPSITGSPSGVFTVIGGAAMIDNATGEFDIISNGVGTYDIIYTTQGACPNSAINTVTIDPNLDASIFNLQPFCLNDAAFTLNAEDNNGIWSGTGITDQNMGVFDPLVAGQGNWEITYIIPGTCGDTSTTNIIVNSMEDATFSYPQALDCFSNNNPVPVIEGTIDGIFSINNNGIIDTITGEIDLMINEQGTYTITYTTTGVCPVASHNDVILCSETTIYAPNAFTPNNDNINDLFSIKGTNLEEIETSIFNRWGESVFSWSGVDSSWDGKTRFGDDAPNGVYVYIIQAIDKNGKRINKRGTITLLN